MLSVIPPSTFECLNQYLWDYVYRGSWTHLNGVLHKSLPSVCRCISLVARKGVGKNVTAATKTYATIELLEVRDVSKERMWLDLPPSFLEWSRESSVGIATGWTAEVRFPAATRDFPLLHNVQTGAGAYPASYKQGTGADFHRG
jgi:hypothetical protein